MKNEGAQYHTLKVIDIICKKLDEPCKYRLYQFIQNISIFIID